ncbi:MAG: bifunctional (p)ppGpp synthetase/guanosine-3',5'-bis(diphosphate) 3'-pyrophosphohydrolase, partial [Myxococcota bacterium]
MLQLTDVLSKVRTYLPQADLDPVKQAYVFASKAHDGQMRRSGEPYVVHPLGVTSIIADLRLDVPSLCAGLLHDCVEDTHATLDDIKNLFGEEIAFLVDGVTKLGKIPWNTKEERQAENFRKMLVAMARDLRVILVKLADRTDNMRTLDHMPPDKQERIARETMEIYAPLANRLGIQWVKVELEDLSFKYLHPVDYQKLAGELARSDRDRKRYTEDTARLIRSVLEEGGVKGAEVTGRIKHLWGIWSKMQRTGRELEQINDVVGFRVLTETVPECWHALGILHAKWTPVPGRFKDFINLPKPNMYQSLHTSVMGPQHERIEIQVRTREMHRTAEQGIAAHWLYKEGRPLVAADEKKFAWLRQLVEWQKDVRDPTEFIESVKVDLFGDEVYVFTPKGDVKAFPKGATPVDFAFAVHSQVGEHCSGARVNGQMVPLRYQLRSGDTIEILTNPHQKPNKDWLKFVATSKAKAKIRQVVRDEARTRARDLGRELLDRELRKYGAGLARAEKSGELAEGAKRLRLTSSEELVAMVGYGKITPTAAVAEILPAERRTGEHGAVGPIAKLISKVTGRAPSGIKVQGMDDLLIRYARCCNPVPGDPIVGSISHGRGVIVHRRDCKKSLDSDPERRVDVEWDTTHKSQRPVAIQVLCIDKPGLLANISKAFGETGVNISQANCRATEEGKAINTFEFNVSDLDQLRNV